MKFFSLPWLKTLCASALLLTSFFITQNSFAGEFALVEELATQGLERGVAEGFASAAERGIGVSAEDIGGAGISQATKEAYEATMKSTLKELGPEIEALEKGAKLEDVSASIEGAFKNQQAPLFEGIQNSLKEEGTFTAAERSLLKGEVPSGIKQIPNELASGEGRVISVKVTEGSFDGAESNALTKSDDLTVSKGDLSAAKESGASQDEIAAKQADVDVAQKNVSADQTTRATQSDANLKTAQAKYEAAEKKVNETTGKDQEAANEELTQAKTELGDATKAKAADERLSYKQEHDIAKQDLKDAQSAKSKAADELKQANKELKEAQATKDQTKIKEAQDKVNSKEANYEAASEKVEQAQKTLLEKEDQLLEKSDLYKNKWDKAKIYSTKGRRAAWEGIKGLPSTVWGKIKFVLDQFIISILFGAPNMAIETYNSAMAKKKLLETKRAYQRWGNIWLKIPEFWINEKDPANSLNVYVGVPNNGYPVTDSMLNNALYYAVKSDYTPWGSSSIFDNISDMVELNNGYLFVSDGQPLDPNEPTVPLFVSDATKQAGLVNELNQLAGKAAAGLKTEGIEYYVDSYEAGYNGNEKVGKLFALPPLKQGQDKLTNFPPLLVPTVKALQDGTTFGTDPKTGKALYLVQGFKGFYNSEQDNGKNIMAALSGSDSATVPTPAKNENYVMQNVYIYQTKDTPIVDLVKKQIAANDPEKQLLLDHIVDYVVMLDTDNNIVPLMTPQPMALPPGSKDSAFARYALNPQIDKMKSLVDGNDKAYDMQGNLEDATIPADLAAPKEIASQITAMQTFFNQKIKYGPFKYNGTTLTIDKNLADANIFVYKAAGFLEGGFDDYFIALEMLKDDKGQTQGLSAASLPSSNIIFFISLVTSRFYDKDLQPYAPPVAPIKDYYVTKDNTIATGKPSDTTLPQAQAPLYTLYVQGEYNPSPKPANFSGILPVPPYWALDYPKFALGGVSPIRTGLKDQTTLLNAIKAAHESWITVLDISNPGALSLKMGPFDFTSGTLENIRLRAFNASAIQVGYYVYTSGRYPDEFVVMSKNADGTDGVGEEFGNQQYLISLSNGNVYDAQANGDVAKTVANLDQLMNNLALNNAGVDSRLANEQKTLEALKKSIQADTKIKSTDKVARTKTIDAQIAAIPTQKTVLYDMVTKIAQSQVAYNRAMINKLYSDDLTFGGRQLYLPKDSYLAGQYIYADVTGLGDPIDANGKEVKAVVDQITDYYVTYEETTDVKTGEKQSVFANPLSKNTLQIVSLISGGGFDRSGAFVVSYQTIKISDKDGQKVYSDLMDFVNKIFTIIKTRMEEEKLPQTIVLQNKIQPLLDAEYKAVKDELERIAEAKKNSLDQYPVKANLAQTLFADTTPYIQQSPALLPHYLKMNTNRYYFVTPPSSDPESDDGKAYEAIRSFIDYDIDLQDHVGPNAKGMLYDRQGKPLQLLTGWTLMSMRAYAGIIIDASGKQQLGIGIEHPALPLTVVNNGKTENTMIDTGIKVPNAGAQFTFFYNTQIDSYFVQIKTSLSNYFIDLKAGYGYNLDGTPRWYEAPLYADDKGEVLLVGTDNFGLKKVAFKKVGATKYLIYNQMVSFGDITVAAKTSGNVKFTDFGNVQGSYFTLLSDSYGDQGAAPISIAGGIPTLQELRIGYAYLDQTGNPLTNPFYIVWDQVQIDNPSFDSSQDEGSDNPKYMVNTKLVGKFNQSATFKFSLLNYVQTRDSASNTVGAYRPEDFYNFPRGACDPSDTTCVKTPKVVGIIFTVDPTTGKQIIKELFYQNQRCILQGSNNTYTTSYLDTTGKTRAITVKLEQSQQQDSPLTARWISITDGGKILDYAHESMVWDVEPMRTDIIETTNLDYRKRVSWQLNVTNFVSNPALTANFPGLHTNALASNLNANKKVTFADLTGCTVSASMQSEIQQGLNAIYLDDSQKGQLYLPHAPSTGTTTPIIKRYVYTFGKNVLEKNLSFYDPGLNGWSVDLNNGILYEPATSRGAYPAGIALQPTDLAELLGFLRLYVSRDTQGNPLQLGISNCNAAKPATILPTTPSQTTPSPVPSK